MPRLLFLDFEGVLTPSAAGGGRMFSRAPLLADALRDAPADVQVVIASTWRLHREVPVLRAMLPQALAERVVGATGRARLESPHPRHAEILAWLEAEGLAQADWRAIDDTPHLYPPDCPQLILCTSTRGIDAPQLAQLEQWWSKG